MKKRLEELLSKILASDGKASSITSLEAQEFKNLVYGQKTILKLRKALVGMVGAGDREELEQMEVSFSSLTDIAHRDKCTAAIRVLIETIDYKES